MKRVIVVVMLITLATVSLNLRNDNEKKSREIKALNSVIKELNERPSVKIPNKYVGEFKITHYCSCPICTGTSKGSKTASGTIPKENRTIAVDKNKIPLGSIVYIEDVGVFVAEDTGGDIKDNRIDIYVEDHDRAIKLGTLNGEKKKVYIIK